jgi:hypothetical protein
MSDQVEAPARPRRKRWKFVLLGVLVLVFALVALAPTLAGRFAPGIASEQFGQRYSGSLTIGSAELGWFGRQRIEKARMLDEGGRLVAEANIELPGLWSLLRGGFQRTRGVEVAIYAELEADEAGVTNLQKALAPRRGTAAPAERGSSEQARSELWPADLDLGVDVTLQRVLWSDARTRALTPPAPVLIENGRLALDVAPGRPLGLELLVPLSGSASGKVEGKIEVRASSSGTPLVDAKLEASGLPTALVDGLAGQRGLLVELCGDELSLTLKAQGASAQGGPVELSLEAPRLSVDCTGTASPSAFSGELQISTSAGRRVAEHLLGKERIEQLGFARADDDVLRVDVKDLHVPLDAASTSALLAQARARVDARLGSAALEASGGPSRFEGLQLALELGQNGAAAKAELRLSGSLDGRPIGLNARASDLGAALAHADGGVLTPFDFELHTGELASEAVERLIANASGAAAPQLSGLLGPTFELDLAAGLSRESAAAPLRAKGSLGARGSLGAGNHAPLAVNFDVALLEASEAGVEGGLVPLGSLDGLIEARGLPTALVDGLTGQGGLLVELCGDELSLSLKAKGASAQGGPFELSLEAPRLSVDCTGTASPSGFSGELQISTSAGRRVAEHLLGKERIEQLGFARADDDVLRMDAQDLHVPFDAASTGALLARVRAKVDARLGSVGLGASGGPSRFEALQLALELGQSGAAAKADLRLSGSFDGRPIDLKARASDLGAALVYAEGGALTPFEFELHTGELTSAAVERLIGNASGAAAPQLSGLLGPTFELDLAAGLSRASAAAPLRAKGSLGARGSLDAGAAVPLSVAFDVALLEASAADGGAGLVPLRSLDAQIAARGLTSIASRLAPQAARPWLTLLGDDAKLSARFDGTQAEPAPLTAQLESGVTRLSLAGELWPTRLKFPGAGIELAITSLPPAVRDELAGYLPAGTRLDLLGGLALHGHDFDLPVGASSLDPALVLPLTNGDLRIELGSIRYVDASLARLQQQLEMTDARVELSLRTGAPLQVRANAKLAGASSGTFKAEVRVPEPARMATLATAGMPPVDADLSVAGLSTAILDAWTGRAGMMPDLLGERLDIELAARGISAKSGTLQAKLVSPLASASLSGNVGEALVFSVEEQRTDLAFALTPLSSKRVVGALVPMLVQVNPVEANQRASLVLSRFQLPLDGDLKKLNGTATLDLGSVDFGFLPGLAELFGPELRAQAQHLGPFALKIQNGVVSYDRLKIDIGGKPVAFSGSCDLGRSEFALELALPLSLAGSSVTKQLDKYKHLLSPDLELPLTLRGSWSKPKIGLADGFIEKLAKDALKGGLLEGLLGGKKK